MAPRFKALGLAAAAVVATTAFVGVSSAAANNVVCTADNSTVACPAGNIVATPQAFTLDLAKKANADTAEIAELTGFNGTVRVDCTTTTEDDHNLEGSWGTDTLTSNNTVAALTDDINSLAFKGGAANACTASNGTTCTVTPNGLPWTGATAITNVPLVAGSNGTLTITLGAGQSVSVKCGFVTCTYTTPAGGIKAALYNASNGNRPDTTGPDAGFSQAFLNGVTVTSGCGNGTWTANYAVYIGTEPNATKVYIGT